MESKIAGMIGVAALAALGSTEALAAPDPDAALQAKSFAELLQPIPNATALLEKPPLRQPRNGRWKAMGSSWRNIIITTITIITTGRRGGVTTTITTTTITLLLTRAP